MYVKHFSRIGAVQQRKDVFYNLTETENLRGKFYGIELVESIGELKATDRIIDISRNKCEVVSFLTLLFENAMQIDSWKAFLDEYLPECCLPEQGKTLVLYG